MALPNSPVMHRNCFQLFNVFDLFTEHAISNQQHWLFLQQTSMKVKGKERKLYNGKLIKYFFLN